MTTLTINNPQIENKYSAYEIKMKFISFLEKDMKNENIDLYEVLEDNLSENTQKRLKDINNLNFVEY